MSSLSPSAVHVAGLVLAALPHLHRLGLAAPSSTDVIAAVGASRSASYEARHVVEEGLSGLFRPPGRPPRSEPVSEVDPREALTKRVVTFLMDHPGCVTGTALRRTYAEVYRVFALDLHHENPDLELADLARVASVPLPTLRDWLRGARTQVERTTQNPALAQLAQLEGPHVAHVETVLAAWSAWKGGFQPFCEHVQTHHRLPLSRQHIDDILHAHGVRIPERRSRPVDDAATRRGIEAFFPGAQWVGDGMELRVVIDGVPYHANLELNVDIASGALVGASIRATEDAEAVVEALQDGVATTGAPPLALTLDNKPSNHAAEVEAVLDDTLKLRARPFTPTDKAHVEGAFGLFAQQAPALAVSTDPATLAGQVAALVFTAWARAANHRPRADRNKATRAQLYQNARPTPEEIEAARRRFAERLAQQEKARETRRRKQDPLARAALDAAFERLGLPDDDGALRAAIACWPLDAVLAGIAIFEGKRRRGTLPDGVDGRYLRGIVVNVATEAESMAIADALLEVRIQAEDEALRGLDADRERLDEACQNDAARLVKRYVERATGSRRQLDRHWWLRAIADVATAHPDERRSLLRLAARHLSAAHALRPKERNAAIRFLFAKAVPVA